MTLAATAVTLSILETARADQQLARQGQCLSFASSAAVCVGNTLEIFHVGDAENAADHLRARKSQRVLEQVPEEAGTLTLHGRMAFFGGKRRSSMRPPVKRPEMVAVSAANFLCRTGRNAQDLLAVAKSAQGIQRTIAFTMIVMRSSAVLDSGAQTVIS